MGDSIVGNNCMIGSNVFMLDDILENSTAVGIPEKVVKKVALNY